MSHARLAVISLLLLALTLSPLSAFASCTLSGNAETVKMTVSPATVTIDPNAAVGAVLATSSLTSPNPATSSVTCTGTTTIGVTNVIGDAPNAGATIYPTNVSGVGYRLLHPDSSYYLLPYGSDSITSGTYTLSVGTVVQLVKTGPIASGSTVTAGTLGTWTYQKNNGTFTAETFSLASAVKFVAPTCTVATTSIAVTLPTVSTTALATTGATAGATAFNIGLTCTAAAAGQDVAVQLDATKQPNGTTGVITLNTSSTSKNVGVQLTDSSFNPVTFGTAADAGTTTTGTYNITYYARYYALTNNVSAGSVSATATFTISYP